MRPEDWSRISPLLDELLELEDEAREARLRELHDEAPELAGEVRRMLALDAEQPEFLAEPVVEGALAAYQPGQMLGPYRLVRPLGEGGMGQVWEALRADGLYERRVALKLLRPGYADASLRTRFTRERLILARLAHVHIARLLDAGITADGQPFLALEYIHGETITDYVRRVKPSVGERLRLFLQICEAVSHAHANLVVHRDLKPTNILVTPAGDVRLLDFGIAKLLDRGGREETEITRAGTRAFTLHYAAPEQIRGEPVTTMTDVYSLGVVLYELLTGSKPYRLQRRTDAEWEEAILQREPTRPSVVVARPPDADETGAVPDRRLARMLVGDLDNIVLKALRKAPEQRYPSVDAMAQDIRRYIEGRPVLARPQSLGYRFRKYLQRHAVGVSVVLGVVLLLSLSLLGVRWQYNQVVAEAARAQAMQDFVVGLFEHGGVAGQERTVDVRQLLDAGVRRAETELNDQLRPRAELLGLIARLRNGLGDYREAVQVLDRQQAALRALGAEAPVGLLLESALQRGRALRALGASDACVDVLRERFAIAERDVRVAPALSAEYYSQLGRCHRQLGQEDEARRLFERALALRRDTPSAGVDEAESLTDLATLDADAARVDTAIAGFRRALDRLRQVAGERHPLAVNIWRNLGSLYRERGDVTAAEGAYRQALDTGLTLYGAQHPITIDVQRLLGALFVELGRLDEGERLVREAHERLRERFGDYHPDIAATHHSLALVAYERGRVDEAGYEIDRAIAIWRQTPATPRLAAALFDRGMILHAAGAQQDASASLGEALALREQLYGSEHALVGATRRLVGEVRAAMGQDAAALEELRVAVDVLRRGYGQAHPQTGLAELSLARQLWRTRAAGQALALAQSVEQRFPPDDSVRRRLAWWARALRAEALCRSGQTAQGRDALDGVLAEMALTWPEGSLRRDIAGILDACRPVGPASRVAG